MEYPEDWISSTQGGVRQGEWPEDQKTEFVKQVFDPVVAQEGDTIPSSHLDPGGRMVSGTNKVKDLECSILYLVCQAWTS